ncbi:MAG: GNAT family N-acetyltransferase [Myxococcales bacterium]|nr:GNAT family N-acetyltransferase [Myxococcales bacterium]
MITWHEAPFEALSPAQLYDIIALRQRVFVVEQDAAYQELDGLDVDAVHISGRDASGALLAYLRLRPGVGGAAPRLERVVVAPSHRAQGLGRALMAVGLAAARRRWPGVSLRIEALAYLTRFYEALGFQPCGAPYTAWGWAHLPMVTSL